MLLKFKRTADQRSRLVFAVTGRRLWKLSRLVQQHPIGTQCQKAMIDVSTHNSVGLFWVSGHSGKRGNEIADDLAKEATVQQYVGPQPALGASRQITRRKIKLWIDSLHMAMWQGLKALISGPSPTSKAQLLCFNRTQSRMVYGPLTGHSTLRRHLYIMGLTDSLL